MDPLVLLGAVGEDAAAWSEALKLAGFRTISAADSLEFLQLGRSSGPEALLLDTRLPWHPAPMVCRLIRAQPPLARVPFFVLSSSTERPLGDRCLEAGANLVLEPSHPKEIAADLLRQALAALPAHARGASV